jgi:hypothetical protein
MNELLERDVAYMIRSTMMEMKLILKETVVGQQPDLVRCVQILQLELSGTAEL